jgi:two-component system, response regulator PdtaR
MHECGVQPRRVNRSSIAGNQKNIFGLILYIDRYFIRNILSLYVYLIQMEHSKIIIFEDEFIPATDLKRQLINLGYEVMSMFTTAEDGLDYLEKSMGTDKFPDAVVMDITLKGKMDGIEAAQRIFEKYPCGVMFLTGLGQLTLFDKIYSKRPSPLQVKPFDIYMVHCGIQLSIYQAGLENRVRKLSQEVTRLQLQG